MEKTTDKQFVRNMVVATGNQEPGQEAGMMKDHGNDGSTFSRESKRDVHSVEQGKRCVHSVEQGKKCVHSVEQGKKCVHSVEQGKRCVHSVEQGKRDVHSVEQGKRCVHSVEQGKRCVHSVEQANKEPHDQMTSQFEHFNLATVSMLPNAKDTRDEVSAKLDIRLLYKGRGHTANLKRWTSCNPLSRPRFIELPCHDVLLVHIRRKIMKLSTGIELQTIRTMNLVR